MICHFVVISLTILERRGQDYHFIDDFGHDVWLVLHPHDLVQVIDLRHHELVEALLGRVEALRGQDEAEKVDGHHHEKVHEVGRRKVSWDENVRRLIQVKLAVDVDPALCILGLNGVVVLLMVYVH